MPPRVVVALRGRPRRRHRLEEASADGRAAPEQGAAGTNREAEHALLRIQDKLAGRVAGTSEVLAVEGQVRALLDEARNEENLCRMYDGWAAWL